VTGAPIRFFVIGVPKAGTTALCAFLGQHPQIFMSPIKEPSYFAASELKSIGSPAVRQGIERQAGELDRWCQGRLAAFPKKGLALNWRSYTALFQNLQEELAIGEGSMAYWWAAGAPEAIRAHFPDARFIVILRQPADRFFSHYLAASGTRPKTSCREFFDLARQGHPECSHWLMPGRYASSLQRYFACFARDQFSIHLYEDYCADPQGVLLSMFRFLGVDADSSIDTSGRFNEPVIHRWPGMQRLGQALPGLSAMARSLPPEWKNRLRRLARTPRAQVRIDTATRQEITSYYEEEIRQTGALISRDLSTWLE
jgi:hypothetical protein